MNIAVCDDQLEELKAVESLLRAWQEQQCAAIRLHLFHNAGELLEAARKERFTLYLLDVMMPGTSGMAAAREIRTFDSAADIVFLTSSPGFAYESYGVQALEYLLKPITAKKLFPLLSRLYLREQKPQEALTLKSNGAFIRVPFSELSYVEVSGKHLYFNMIDGQVREVVGVLREFEPLLPRVPSLCASTGRISSICCRSASCLLPGCRPFRGRACRYRGFYTHSFRRIIWRCCSSSGRADRWCFGLSAP